MIRQKKVRDRLLLYAGQAGDGIVLNRSAQAIWRLCDGTHSIDQISSLLEQRLELPSGSLLGDVRTTVSQLADQHLLNVTAPLTPASFEGIDWSRIAEPQDDEYDTEVALRLLAERYPAKMPAAEPGNGPGLFDGAVAVTSCYRGQLPKDLEDAPSDHPNLEAAEGYVRIWPTANRQVRRLMHSLHPLIDPVGPQDESAFLSGSRCHSEEAMPGTMWSTINCSLMLADNCVHEMAHQKLFAMGIFKEASLGLITNPRDDLYRSPVITDKGRPMTAVVHGVYAFAYVTELDLRVLPTLGDAARRSRLVARVERSTGKLAEGLDEIRQHIQVDSHGRVFMEGMYSWLERLIRAGRAVDAGAGRTGS